MKKTLASDNYAGTSPEIIEAIAKVSNGHQGAYGADDATKEAIKMFKRLLKEDIDVFFTMNGTGANVTALSSVCPSYGAVITSSVAHINVDECGAPEKFGGFKILTIEKEDGKISPEDISPFLVNLGEQHWSQPKVVSITQATEYGTVYTCEEIKAIADFAHQNNLLLHVDGARISNAAVSIGATFKEMLVDTGVDFISFGGTKNGLMFGEAVIFLNTSLSENYKYLRKQGMQLLSKMRFISAQFVALFDGDLWKKNAEHANKMAQLLAEGLQKAEGAKVTQKVQANGVFAILDPKVIPILQEQSPFYVWNEQTHEVRLMCSFDTTEEEINQFITTLEKYQVVEA
ncbi:aminotransferase class V-fold PLP-dependent enzyme [Flammeovirga sp. MY04]|uniref:threonine aldolase family protein n=1 Tax=Flammeovirga sp. MY04 TaxID=1191459 RepID=UPI0008062386|nr:aminotransferase class V-fold PLP-dependent enzyme [Flammeovirga sp. MY04]ANQ50140.1 aminotransferase class V-fold PLP-dependent enzyme [Flammeovirga sp. MY04]